MKKVMVRGLVGLMMLGSALVASDVVATVNGKTISREDIDTLLKAMPGVNFDSLKPDVKQKVIEQAIERELLKQNAIKSGIQNSPTFKEALEKIKEDLSLEVWMKQEFEKITISDAEAKKFYDANPEKFVMPEQAKARHILLKDEAEAKKVIEELKKSSKEKLESAFIAMAKEKSTGPSNSNGGDLGWFSKDQMVKEFADAAFALKKGEITQQPVKTQFGYHVIYLEDKKPQSKVSFDEIKERIKQNLKLEKFKDHMAAKAQELKKGAKIEIK